MNSSVLNLLDKLCSIKRAGSVIQEKKYLKFVMKIALCSINYDDSECRFSIVQINTAIHSSVRTEFTSDCVLN